MKKPTPVKAKPTPEQFKDRDLCNVNPTKEQFEPTDQVPVSQHKRMAGTA